MFTVMLPMSHFSGHEVFGGLEISSRIKVLNVNLRAGLHYLGGDRNYYQEDNKTITATEDKFTSAPFNQTMFVVTAGFSLGSKKANGRNIARLF